MTETSYIIVPLAKGAIKDVDYGRYIDIDQEVARRIDGAVALSECLGMEGPQLWVFGAGTEESYRHGPTLGVLAKRYLNCHYNHLSCFANQQDKHFYGTLEEIQWVVDQLAAGYSATDEYCFVFFTQRRHMRRVKLIWRLFHQERWGLAKFVMVDHAEEVSLWREVVATARVRLVYYGFIESRCTKPYPS